MWYRKTLVPAGEQGILCNLGAALVEPRAVPSSSFLRAWIPEGISTASPAGSAGREEGRGSKCFQRFRPSQMVQTDRGVQIPD